MDPASRRTRIEPLGLSQHLLRFAGLCRGFAPSCPAVGCSWVARRRRRPCFSARSPQTSRAGPIRGYCEDHRVGQPLHQALPHESATPMRHRTPDRSGRHEPGLEARKAALTCAYYSNDLAATVSPRNRITPEISLITQRVTVQILGGQIRTRGGRAATTMSVVRSGGAANAGAVTWKVIVAGRRPCPRFRAPGGGPLGGGP